MRVKPKFEEEYRKIDLIRWDQWSSLNPLSVCQICIFYDCSHCKCTNSDNMKYGYNINLYDMPIDAVSCNQIVISENIKPFLRENPYDGIQNREQIRKQLANEIDISFFLKYNHIHMNNINIEKIEFLKNKYNFYGYEVVNNGLSERVDNLLAQRKVNTIQIRKSQIFYIQVFRNGNLLTFFKNGDNNNNLIAFESSFKKDGN